VTEMSSTMVGEIFPPVDVRYRPANRHMLVPNVAAVDVYDGYTGVYPGPRLAVHANEVWLQACPGSDGCFYVIEVGSAGPYRRAAEGA